MHNHSSQTRSLIRRTKQFCVSTLCILAFTACDKPSPEPSPTESAIASSPVKTDSNTPPAYIESGDLTAIAHHGKIRILIPRWEDSGLPRAGLPSHGFRELAEEFASTQGLEVQWILNDNHTQLIEQLEKGEGDLIVAHLTQTPAREKRITFTLPISSDHEQIIGAATQTFNHPEQLANKHIAVGAGSSFVASLTEFSAKHPQLNLTISELNNGDPEYFLDQIQNGHIDATIMDNHVAEALAKLRDDFSIGLTITPTRPIAWAVRKNNPQLLAKLNAYLTEARITHNRNNRFTGDFSEIKARKTLRVITRNSPTSYFLWRGELMGYEYQLMKKFAERQGLRLEVEVAPPGQDMFAMLKEGRGDVIAASTTITAEREARGIDFSRPYHLIQEQLVSHKNAPPLDSLAALAGRTLTLKPDHAYWSTAVDLLNKGHNFTLAAASKDQTSTDIIAAVARDELDATIADSHLVSIEHKFNENLQPGLKLEPQRALGWAVRDSNPELLAALDHYIKLHYRGTFFNVTYNKYFKNEKRIDKYQGQRLTDDSQLSPFDAQIKPLAEQYHFDWRLLVAQMYQESKFNPKAKSYAGALGLFQVMPRTAKELGVELPLTPESGIYAGIRYLDWARDRFEATLPLEERLWFTLAAYNAGFGHVNDARRLARQQGLDGDRWFGNVEQAMLMLSKRQYYTKARFGYVRGTEPVNYVRQIRNRYYAYLKL